MVSQNCNETGVTATKKEKYKKKMKEKNRNNRSAPGFKSVQARAIRTSGYC